MKTLSDYLHWVCENIARTQQKTHNLFRVDEKTLNNVVLPTLFNVVNNIVQHC